MSPIHTANPADQREQDLLALQERLGLSAYQKIVIDVAGIENPVSGSVRWGEVRYAVQIDSCETTARNTCRSLRRMRPVRQSMIASIRDAHAEIPIRNLISAIDFRPNTRFIGFRFETNEMANREVLSFGTLEITAIATRQVFTRYFVDPTSRRPIARIQIRFE